MERARELRRLRRLIMVAGVIVIGGLFFVLFHDDEQKDEDKCVDSFNEWATSPIPVPTPRILTQDWCIDLVAHKADDS